MEDSQGFCPLVGDGFLCLSGCLTSFGVDSLFTRGFFIQPHHMSVGLPQVAFCVCLSSEDDIIII